MPFTPIIPFEPISTIEIPQGENWMAQIKWDGVRIATYFDGNEVRLYNRKKNERTFHYPEITAVKSYCTAKSVILDGELIALNTNGLPSFHEIMRRDGLRNEGRMRQMQNVVKVTYMVFDILYWNGLWVTQMPLKERAEILSDSIIPNDDVQLVPFFQDTETLYEVVKAQQMEGIVIKDLNSTYVIGGKDKRWQKKKFYQDLFAVIAGVALRDGAIQAFLLGLYDKNVQLWYIGHTGPGKMTDGECRLIADILKELQIKENPFINSTGPVKNVLWVKPAIVVRVHFLEWTVHKTMRQPVIQGIANTAPEECLW